MSHLRSYWSESGAKDHLYPYPFAEFSNLILPRLLLAPSGFNIRRLLDGYAAVFGKSSISFISYEGARASSNLFSVLVKDVLGLSMDGFVVKRDVFGNPSPPTAVLDTLAQIPKITKCPITKPFHASMKLIQDSLSLFPMNCGEYTGGLSEIERLLSLDDDLIFAEYGKPLYLPPQNHSTPICTVDIDATLSTNSSREEFYKLSQALTDNCILSDSYSPPTSWQVRRVPVGLPTSPQFSNFKLI
mmetsp:Transcript_21800/g.33874  ORF Transcript_21800/g.33874 Transcript_21800/m.33874 type:complete len:244 (-) Transcript_21800:61-792(-)